jgi:hypothetical protein
MAWKFMSASCSRVRWEELEVYSSVLSTIVPRLLASGVELDTVRFLLGNANAEPSIHVRVTAGFEIQKPL